VVGPLRLPLGDDAGRRIAASRGSGQSARRGRSRRQDDLVDGGRGRGARPGRSGRTALGEHGPRCHPLFPTHAVRGAGTRAGPRARCPADAGRRSRGRRLGRRSLRPDRPAGTGRDGHPARVLRRARRREGPARFRTGATKRSPGGGRRTRCRERGRRRSMRAIERGRRPARRVDAHRQRRARRDAQRVGLSGRRRQFGPVRKRAFPEMPPTARSRAQPN